MTGDDAEMQNIALKYTIPPELFRFITGGLLKLLSEDEAEKTVKFDIPTLAWTDDEDRHVTFTLVWIHPDFNEEFCHYFDQRPGDLPNFYLFKETSGLGDDWLEIDTLDDLVVWLQQQQDRFG
jgi:hypothetical protein